MLGQALPRQSVDRPVIHLPLPQRRYPLPRRRCVSRLMELGQLHGIANAGYRAIDSLRLEKGYR
ncbi:MAG TPA: hypothetical protein EYO88_12050, partial [Alphaproteobacteria bacterium]|nr:hypothetical protein [Alphaproteobacteria bacterium]